MGRLRRILVAVASAVLTALGLEGGAALLLEHPTLLPDAAVPVFRRYYRNHEWRNMQLEPECARYDPELTYTLRPGVFRFGAREFENEYRVNRLGLRGAEEALDAPAIVVLGDSHTLGWGVEEDETFGARLGAALGRRVLLAGVPSYGTAREVGLLGRVDLSGLEVLVIQYCPNDLEENRAWVAGGGRLQIRGPAEMREMAKAQAERSWSFGRHTLGLSRVLLRRVREGEDAIRFPPGPVDPPDEAPAFVTTLAGGLARLGIDLDGVEVVLIELNANAANDGTFLAAVEAEIARRPGLPPALRALTTVDVSAVLDEDDYYVLDSHMRPSGHAKVAALLERALR